MLFNSLAFVLFLSPLPWRRWYLLAASYAFYCTWSETFAVLLLGLSAAAFVMAQWIAAASDDGPRRRRLAATVVVLFLPLVALKYWAPFRPVLAAVVGGPWAAHLVWAGVAVPVGISYYTLKLVSYVVDVYWDRLAPSRQFSAVAAYAAFFPQILSGPIQRAGDFMRQIERIRPTDPELIASGLRLILFGLFEKLVVADRLGGLVDQVYDSPRAHAGLALTVATYAFAFQLYADFSGLTDIAIGAGRVLGITAPPNFDAPFYAANIQEFWRRWHMTLTGWVRDYLFTPLRMVLRDWGQVGLAASLVVNMVAVGIWHVPGLTFVIFGLIHGAYLFGSSLTLRKRERWFRQHPRLDALHAVIGPVITFHMVVATLVLFRASSLGLAWYAFRESCHGLLQMVVQVGHPSQLGALLRGLHLDWSRRDTLVACGAVVVMESLHLLQRRGALPRVIVAVPGWMRWAGYYALALSILLWAQTGSRQFIYAEF